MADTEPEATEEVKNGMGVMGLVKAVAFISVVVIVEVVAASVLIPSAQDAEQTARDLAAAKHGEMAIEGEEEVDSDAMAAIQKETREVELGQYNVTRYNPETDTTLVVDFELFGVVLAEDVEHFTTQWGTNMVSVREQVIMTLGGADVTDLTDANLGLLKRRILEKSNRALGKPFVREVLFSKFNFVER